MKALRKWFAVLSAVSMIVIGLQLSASADTNRVEFQDYMGLIMFDGEINGHEGKFLLDSGADNSMINTRLTSELGIVKNKGGFGILGLLGLNQYRVNEFAVGEDVYENIDLIGMDLSTVERYLGFDLLCIVGGDLLGHFALTIDYQDQVFYLQDSSPKPGYNATSVPMVVSDKLVFVKGKTGPDDPEHTYLVDTGATATLFFKNRFLECCPDYLSYEYSPGWEEATLLGKSPADMYMMPLFHVGDIGIESMAIITSEPGIVGLGLQIVGGVPVYGIIGYSFLKNFKVTFDYPKRKLTLEPYEYYVERFPYMFDSVGIMIAYENGVPIVDHILPGTPAEQSGILENDKLIEIDGKDVTSMDFLEISLLMDGKPGTTVKVLLERDGKRFSKSLKRIYLFHR